MMQDAEKMQMKLMDQNEMSGPGLQNKERPEKYPDRKIP
jgi:hypothetical protein